MALNQTNVEFHTSLSMWICHTSIPLNYETNRSRAFRSKAVVKANSLNVHNINPVFETGSGALLHGLGHYGEYKSYKYENIL